MTLPWALGVPLCVLGAAWVSAPRRHAGPTRTEGRGRLGRALADAIGGIGYVRQLVRRPLRYLGAAAGFPVFGAGGVDAAMVFSLSAVGVPLGTALLGVFAYRVATYWLPLVPALWVVPRLTHQHPSPGATPAAS